MQTAADNGLDDLRAGDGLVERGKVSAASVPAQIFECAGVASCCCESAAAGTIENGINGGGYTKAELDVGRSGPN